MSQVSSPSKLTALGWPVLCAAVALGYSEWRAQRLDAELASRPPVAILTVDASVLRLIEENPGLKAEEAIARVRGAGQKLADAGYVVFDSPQVYGYPVDIEAQP
jgi:hypothetical protein